MNKDFQENIRHKKREIFISLKGGPDGTRTRDPMRDRHVF